ncbi:hypothetical protein N9174_01550 [bacterium]|nr:hypothetical protein [bacterium]
MFILDEPVEGLNAEEIEEVSEFILGLVKSGMTILLIEFRMEMVNRLCQRGLLAAYHQAKSMKEGNNA